MIKISLWNHSYMESNNINNNLYDIVIAISKHPILKEYLRLYLKTDQGRKELNLRYYAGRTILIHVSQYENTTSSIETLKLLIESGANINLQDENGNTALIYACKFLKITSAIGTIKLILDKN